MRVTIDLNDEVLSQQAKGAALEAARAQVTELFERHYERKGDGYVAVENAVAEALGRLPLAEMVDRIVHERAEVIVRERLDARLAKLVDREVKARTGKPGSLFDGEGSQS